MPANDGLLPELQIAEYYRSGAIHSRIAEYCDGTPENLRAFGGMLTYVCKARPRAFGEGG